MIYRKEIDGLRALAVLPVMLFHAGFKTFSGGFVGVDIFFVISGYLITSIIIKEINEEQFSLLNFYERRARRILPALYFIIIVTIPFAFFFMHPDDLDNYGQSLVANIFFANNILLWMTSGYWSAAIEFKPLVHTWSLAVEEQYYLIFPILMIIIWPLGRKFIFWFILILGILSLVASHAASKDFVVGNFYLLPTRIWELMMGALAALFLEKRNEVLSSLNYKIKNLLSLIGFALIVFSIFSFDKNTPFPSFWALFPTFGTLLIILFSDKKNFIGNFLCFKPLVKVGLISYSLYLWHQPLFAFTRLQGFSPPNDLYYIFFIIISFPLAYFSWRFIEIPFRDIKIFNSKKFFIYLSLTAFLILSLGLIIYKNSGFYNQYDEMKSPFSEAFDGNQNIGFNHLPYEKFFKNQFVDLKKKNVLILGDSFARDFINMGDSNNYFRNYEISYADNHPLCLVSVNKKDIENFLRDIDILIFGSPIETSCWNKNREFFDKLVDKIIVVGTKDFGYNINPIFRVPKNERKFIKTKISQEVIKLNDKYKKEFSNLYVDIIAMTSDGNSQTKLVTPEGKLISIDKTHLTYWGAKYYGEIVFKNKLLSEFK